MEDLYNLIYNGKMLHGMDGYTTACGSQTMTIDTADKPTGCAASYSLQTNGETNSIGYLPLMPYINEDTYKLSFQYKDNGSTENRLYIAMNPLDNKGRWISAQETSTIYGAAITTLAQDLNNGDTVVYLTSVSGWIADTNYRKLGIIESAAYGDNRCLTYETITQNGIDTTNNTITLAYAWNGGTYKAGSKVREFTSDSTFFYPFSWTDKPSTWTNKDVLFDKTSDGAQRLPFAYFLGFGTLYTKGKFANLQFENVSHLLARIPMNLQNEMPVSNITPYIESTSSVNQYGQLNTGMLSEGFLPVRYIRDWCNGWASPDGSSSSASSHWMEIQAFDRWERNVAFAADGYTDLPEHSPGGYNNSRGGLNSTNTTTYKQMHIITKGFADSQYYIDNYGGSVDSVTIDMGIIHYIDKIKVWHVNYSGRLYHNTKTEVSVDGVNWITVFDSAIEGEYQETSDGHTITFDKLGTLYHASMKKGGETLVQDIIED